jgi:uncharacterized repeat protein (TIGR02543 family)
LTVTFRADVAAVNQPGTYYAALNLASVDPVKPNLNIPVTMTVTPPATWGQLTGVVNGLAVCDVNPAPLANAAVLVESATMSWTLTTNAGGVYQVWADAAQAPLTVTVSKSGFVGQSVAGVSIGAGVTTTQNFDLRPLAPCASSAPSDLSTTLVPNQQQTQTLTISNTGAVPLTWEIKEEPALLAPVAALSGDATLSAPVVVGPANDVVGNTPEAGKEPQPSALGLASQPYTPAGVLYNNGPLTTNPGSGAGGADASALQTSLGLTSYGAGHALSSGYRVADDFVVSGGSWQINTITFFAYQTGSGTTSTINHVNLRIWDGVPGAAGSNIVWGDTATNRLSNTIWSNISRVLDTDLTNADRPIMADTVNVGITLPPGTYWLDWQTGGTGASGPWAPPISILGQTTTGNARQYNGSAWAALTDGGTVTPQGLPFIIEGSSGCSTDLPWVSTAPISGTTMADGYSEVGVVFDSLGLNPGVYTGELCIITNDAAHPKLLVPVALTVNPQPVQLTVNTVGNGTAAQDPGGPYVISDVVTLTVTPATGWSFVGWSGDLSGSTSPITIELTSDKVVTATFAPNSVNLTVNVVGNGSVTKAPDQAYYNGDVVTLTANADTHWAFAGWSGDLSGTANPTAITLTGDKVVTATFASTCVPVSGVDFTYLPTAPKVNKIVTFDGTATGTTPITYTWNFGDGSAVGSGTPITHLFPITLTTHSYTVTMTAANACGTVPVLKSLTVQPQTILLPIVFK